MARAEALLILLPALAIAGHYEAGMTSGLSVSVQSGGPPSYGHGSCSISGGGGNGSATLGGTLTTVFTWVPDVPGDAPPQKVVAMESCTTYASARAYPSGSPTGSADNGLDPRFCTNTHTDDSPIYYPIPVPPYRQLIGNGSWASSSGTAPRIVSGGQTVTVTCSPSTTCASGSGPLSISLSYSASVSPIGITLTGPRKNAGADECMIGKGVSGVLSAPGLSLDQYAWGVGGSTFKSYTASQALGKVYDLDGTDLSQAQPHWFWKEASSALVSCTARASYNGIVIGSASAQRGVAIYAPYSAFGANVHSSSLYFDGGQYGTSVPSSVATWNPATVTDPAFGFCIDFYGEVGTPQRFWESGSAGQHCYAQLANIHNVTSFGGGGFGGIPYFQVISTDGRFDLDNDFPYPGSGYWNADSVESPGPDPNQHVTQDGPSLGLPLPARAFSLDDQYKMYQLYRPPGPDVAWVPLNRIAWECVGGYEVPWLPSGSAVPGSIVQQTSSGPVSTHPEWTNVFGNQEIEEARTRSAPQKEVKK